MDELSPDKKYFFVNFSEGGSSGDDSSQGADVDQYVYGFVRMSNGCVERVEAGQICAGKWDASSNWIGLDGASIGRIDYSKPTIESLLKKYSENEESSPRTSPGIDKYLLDGKGFDNILACDPVNGSNKFHYEGLMKLFERDGDSVDADKVKSSLKGVK